MTDIVERLRASLQLHGPHLLRNADIAEAAAEIEALRAESNISDGLLADAKTEVERLHALLDGDAAEIMRLIHEIERERYNASDDFSRSIDEAYRVIRERVAAGGKGWEPP